MTSRQYLLSLKSRNYKKNQPWRFKRWEPGILWVFLFLGIFSLTYFFSTADIITGEKLEFSHYISFLESLLFTQSWKLHWKLCFVFFSAACHYSTSFFFFPVGEIKITYLSRPEREEKIFIIFPQIFVSQIFKPINNPKKISTVKMCCMCFTCVSPVFTCDSITSIGRSLLLNRLKVNCSHR